MNIVFTIDSRDLIEAKSRVIMYTEMPFEWLNIITHWYFTWIRRRLIYLKTPNEYFRHFLTKKKKGNIQRTYNCQKNKVRKKKKWSSTEAKKVYRCELSIPFQHLLEFCLLRSVKSFLAKCPSRPSLFLTSCILFDLPTPLLFSQPSYHFIRCHVFFFAFFFYPTVRLFIYRKFRNI